MNRTQYRGTAAVALAAAAVTVTLAAAPAASASAPQVRRPVQCETVLNSSATSGTGATTTHCAKGVAARGQGVAGRDGTASSVQPGAAPSKHLRSSTDLRGWVSTGLHFRNSTSSTVSVTIMYYDPASCGGYGDWATQGWWNIAPGQEVNVKNTSNRYATFHAHSDRLDWSGPYTAYVKSSAFQSCVNIGSTDSRIVGERLVDLGDVSAFPYTTYTVNLTQ